MEIVIGVIVFVFCTWQVYLIGDQYEEKVDSVIPDEESSILVVIPTTWVTISIVLLPVMAIFLLGYFQMRQLGVDLLLSGVIVAMSLRLFLWGFLKDLKGSKRIANDFRSLIANKRALDAFRERRSRAVTAWGASLTALAACIFYWSVWGMSELSYPALEYLWALGLGYGFWLGKEAVNQLDFVV
ncbi:MAG: hypothetical protein PHC51_07010 [bacterium]|nr:hypothetical protein [bacterium]